MTTITIAARFRGPEDSGNGGYTCGVIASVLGGDVEVTLRRPPPLDRPLEVRHEYAGRVSVLDGDAVMATAERVSWEIAVPDPPELDDAVAASARYAGFLRHAFPTCFVCGTERTHDDGLRVFAGPVEGRDLWAAPWRPSASLPASEGVLAPEIVWSVLDCPGAWSVERASQARPVVLGRMAARIIGRADVDAGYLAVAWPSGEDGRKLYARTALFTESGSLVAAARQTWIVLA